MELGLQIILFIGIVAGFLILVLRNRELGKEVEDSKKYIYTESDVITLTSKIVHDVLKVNDLDKKLYVDMNLREKAHWFHEWLKSNLKNYNKNK